MSKTHFEFQVYANGSFRSVRPTGESPYRYDTAEEAAKNAALCYGVANRLGSQTIWRVVLCSSETGEVIKEIC